MEINVPEFNANYRPNGLSVVIPNYNGADLLKKTLPPLEVALQKLEIPWEVIVADDCSTDQSTHFIRQNFPWITLLEKPENEGFSKTINTGIGQARFELVFLMNSDIILTPDYFGKQFKYFSLPDTFGVCGRIAGWDDNFIQDGARLPAFELFKLKISRHYIPTDLNTNPCFTLYLSGANALLNREKLLQLKGFNEIFSPFYAEDLELSVRAWRRGWKCYYEHQVLCRHRLSATIRTKARKDYIKKIYYRNKLFFHGIHLPALYLAGFIIQTACEALLRLMLFNPILLQSLLMFAKQRRQWMKARNEFAKTPGSVSLPQVVKNLKRSVKKSKVVFFRSGQISAPEP
ncbi:MAG: hypothetical protein KatS3mg032_0359 [Cyclobacteriaceae bacterium]|nr:MAG: hypothetical protein KatS3mg032_0359 [Cyclobacteriaceae bacterium]